MKRVKVLFRIIYMKADFEPWWQFDDWEDYIVTTYEYRNEESFEQGLAETLERFRNLYHFEKCKNDEYYAFWNEDEMMYCEGCDEDTQVYHGLIVKKV